MEPQAGNVPESDTKELPEGWLPVLSGSMAPLMRRGDMVRFEPVESEKVRIGDIVAFHRADRLTAHRVIEFDKRLGKLRQMGDFQFPSDWIESASVLGRVRALRRGQKVLMLDQFMVRAASVILALYSRVTATLWGDSRSGRIKVEQPSGYQPHPLALKVLPRILEVILWRISAAPFTG